MFDCLFLVITVYCVARLVQAPVATLSLSPRVRSAILLGSSGVAVVLILALTLSFLHRGHLAHQAIAEGYRSVEEYVEYSRPRQTPAENVAGRVGAVEAASYACVVLAVGLFGAWVFVRVRGRQA